jgi:hypothetical protein
VFFHNYSASKKFFSRYNEKMITCTIGTGAVSICLKKQDVESPSDGEICFENVEIKKYVIEVRRIYVL